MRKTEIRVERVEAFFQRGRKLARLADHGDPIPPSRVVAFDDIQSPPRRGVIQLRKASKHDNRRTH